MNVLAITGLGVACFTFGYVLRGYLALLWEQERPHIHCGVSGHTDPGEEDSDAPGT